ncbi:MAG: hypothetical protein IPI77_19770 [Saprospiraceae bacterium]|nr:hypothetical protein [Saprospiraceae bacterium]
MFVHSLFKKYIVFLTLIVFVGTAFSQAPILISIETKDNALILATDQSNRLLTTYFGNDSTSQATTALLPPRLE